MAQPGLEHVSGPLNLYTPDYEHPQVIVPREKKPLKYFSVNFIIARARAKRWVLLSVLIALIIAAAIAGGVAGGLQHSRTTSNATSPTSTAKPSTIQTSTTSIPIMSGTATPQFGYYYPTAISWGYPHLSVFTTYKTSTVYWVHRGIDSSDTTWTPANELANLGGVTASFEYSIAAASRSYGNIDIFITGGDGDSVYHNWQNQSSSWARNTTEPWDFLDGSWKSVPSALSWESNRIDIFVIGNDYSVYTKSLIVDSSWTDWNPILAGTWTAYAPTVVSWGSGRIDLFVVEPNTNSLYHAFYSQEAWEPANGFENMGGYCASRPVAISTCSGCLDIFVRGGDAALWHISFNSTGWFNWTSISPGYAIQGEPEAVSWGADRIDVFAWGSDGSLFHKSLVNNTHWEPETTFEVLGTGLGGPPKAVSDGVGSLHVFCFDRFEVLQHLWFNQSVGSWSPSPAGSFEVLGTPEDGP